MLYSPPLRAAAARRRPAAGGALRPRTYGRLREPALPQLFPNKGKLTEHQRLGFSAYGRGLEAREPSVTFWKCATFI